MTQIVQGHEIVTLINVFIVTPQDQQALIEVLIEAPEKVMNTQPGFLSANIHKSLDGTHVVNYAQWRSREDFEAMLTKPEVLHHMEAANRLAKVEPHLYEVAFIDEALQVTHVTHALHTFVTFAMQQGMLWIGHNEARFEEVGPKIYEPASINRLGGWIGVMATSHPWSSPESFPNEADRSAGYALGRRVSEATIRWAHKEGVSIAPTSEAEGLSRWGAARESVASLQ